MLDIYICIYVGQDRLISDLTFIFLGLYFEICVILLPKTGLPSNAAHGRTVIWGTGQMTAK